MLPRHGAERKLAFTGNDAVTKGFATRIQCERAVVKQFVAQAGIRAE